MTAKYILVQGTVYKQVLNRRRTGPIFNWMRVSVPPRAVPGKRCRQPFMYPGDRLPEHEVIDETRALAIQGGSVERWTEALRDASEAES